MRFCNFLNKLYERFPCSNQGQFVLEVFSALCGETDPVGSNRPYEYVTSSCLPSGLCGTDPTSRKRLFGNTDRYKGLTNPIKKHVYANAKKQSFVAYCEASISVEQFQGLCADFNVSSDSSRAVVFEGIFEMFMDFARSGTDSAADNLVAEVVIERLMNPPAETANTDYSEAIPTSLCAGDDFRLVRQSPSSPHKNKFYETLTHHWVIKNSGLAIWNGRYMDFVNVRETPLKMAVTRFDIKKTPPGGEVTITVNVEVRHIEGIHEIILDMKDCEGRLCFPDKRAELHLPVTVGWNK